MTPEQWERLKPVFDEALQLPESERTAFVERQFPDDPFLRGMLGQLVAGHERARSFLADGDATPLARERHVFAEGALVGGRFRIIRFLGRGGMGEVYEARDERLLLRVALKTIRPEYATDPETVARFEREIRVAREVTHENLCRVYDLVEHEDAVCCFTMEFLEGQTLQELLRSGRLSPSEALPLIRQIASALDALHKAGIVHRDLKPGNIMLVQGDWTQPRAVLTDFGLAKPLRDARDPFESRFDLPAGAPYFMAPELFRGGGPSRASDIYAFGLVIDEMVTTGRAFAGQSVDEIRRNKLELAPVPPVERSQRVPAHWNATILRCLSFDPATRPASVNDVVEALESGKRGLFHAPWVAWSGGAAAAVLGGILLLGPPPPQEKSLVVFDPEESGNQPLRVGRAFAAEIVNRLSRLERLRVVRYYDVRSRAAPGVVKERYHLDGDIETAGSRMRLTLRLTDEGERRVVWSDRFEGESRNTFELQSRAAAAVYRQLGDSLLRDAVTAAGVQYSGYRLLQPLLLSWQESTAPRQNNAAYEHYVRGRQLFEDRTLPSTLAAIESYKKALVLEPGFALAYAAMSEAYTNLIELRYAAQEELVKQARESAEKAIGIDASLPDAQMMMARVEQLEWNWEAAEARFREVMRAHPGNARARRMYSAMIMQFGRFDEGLRENKRALELDPYDYPAQSAYAFHLFVAGRTEEALTAIEETLARKDFLYGRNMRAMFHARRAWHLSGEMRRAELDIALAEADYVAQQESKSGAGAPTPISDHMHAVFFALLGRRPEAQHYLRRLEAASDRTGVTGIAQIHALLGEPDKAMGLLRQAYSRRERWLYHLKVHPFWEPLAGRADFREIVQAMRL